MAKDGKKKKWIMTISLHGLCYQELSIYMLGWLDFLYRDTPSGLDAVMIQKKYKYRTRMIINHPTTSLLLTFIYYIFICLLYF